MLPIKDVVKNKTVKRGHICKQLWLTLTISPGFAAYGFHNGWFSPMKELLESEDSPSGTALTSGELSWVACSMMIGAMIGVPMHMYAADALGRKLTILISFILQGAPWVILLISSKFPALVVARLIAGIGNSGTFMLSPMYVKEICKDDLRGTLITFCAIMQYIGILIMYILGRFMNYYILLWILLGVSIITTSSIFMIPETPAFMVKKGKIEKATKTLATVRGLDVNDEIIQNEINYMITQDQHYKTVGNINILAILKNKVWRRAWVLVMVITTTVSFNGSFCIVVFAHSIITASGVTINPELQTLGVPVLMIIGSIFPPMTVDKFGRKPLLVGTFVLSSLSTTALATCILLKEYKVAYPEYVPILAMSVTVFAYAMGVLPVSQLVMTELFEFEVRAKLMGCVFMQVWATVCVQVACYSSATAVVGVHSVFYAFAFVNFCASVIVLMFLPETKGRTQEEIGALLLGEKLDSAK